MITRSFEEELQKTGKLVCPNQGTSMLPLIRQGRDLMVIHPRPSRRLKKYEAVMYRRGNNYLLHRIYKVCEKDYIMCADNRSTFERVQDDQIIGILYAVLRDGTKEIKVKSPAYLSYIFYWYYLHPVLKKIKQLFKTLIHYSG